MAALGVGRQPGAAFRCVCRSARRWGSGDPDRESNRWAGQTAHRHTMAANQSESEGVGEGGAASASPDQMGVTEAPGGCY